MCEGEYLKGEKNRKVKEYDDYGRLKFEGEYSNNEKINGKEYYNNGKIRFEGEYKNKNKKMWNGQIYDVNGKAYIFKNGYGNVKEYDIFSDLDFEGELKNGEK